MTHVFVDDIQTLQDRIVLKAAELANDSGWGAETLEAALQACDCPKNALKIYFPAGLKDVLSHLYDYADRKMLEQLAAEDTPPDSVRAKVKHAVLTRWSVLAPYRPALKQAGAYWLNPLRAGTLNRILWRTADRIWIYAGDTATDYNRYTKRILLVSVLKLSAPVWFAGDDEIAEAFLSRRLDNVVSIGKHVGQLLGRVQGKRSA